MKQANHQGAERYIENNVYRLSRVPLASLPESRRSDSHLDRSLAEFFSDLAGSLLAGYIVSK